MPTNKKLQVKKIQNMLQWMRENAGCLTISADDQFNPGFGFSARLEATCITGGHAVQHGATPQDALELLAEIF